MRTLRFWAPAVLLAAAGCKTVQPVREPSQFIPNMKPDLVVVIDQDNAEIPVAQPMMAGDTLKGIWAGVGDPVAMPLSQVQRIDAVQPNKKRTTMMIVGLTVVGAAGVYALIQAATGGGDACDYAYTPSETAGEGRSGACITQ